MPQLSRNSGGGSEEFSSFFFWSLAAIAIKHSKQVGVKGGRGPSGELVRNARGVGHDVGTCMNLTSKPGHQFSFLRRKPQDGAWERSRGRECFMTFTPSTSR
ncbi:unnamed protein product [Gadus morhua 'NCC']